MTSSQGWVGINACQETVVVSRNSREWIIWQLHCSFIKIWRQLKETGLLELQSWSGSSVRSLHILSVLWKQINGTVGVTLLLSVKYKKYRLALISTASAQLCYLWGLCVQTRCVFTWNSAFCVSFFVFLAFLWSLCHKYKLFKYFIMLSMFFICACVCACVFVCPDEELSGFSRLHRCRYGGISDTELVSSSSKRPIKNDTLMILWTFTCSSSELCHMVWKKIGYYSASFFPSTFLRKFSIHYHTNLSNNPAL